MAEYDIETLNAEIAGFHEKYENIGRKLLDDNVRGEYLADADAVIEKYPNPDGEVREQLGEFCDFLGCWIIVYGNDLEHGVPYYHKALELCPNSWDIHFEYFTTLKEIIPDKRYSTPELIQDAIDCLTFCIDYCTTRELMAKYSVDRRYWDLAWVYETAGQKELSWKYAKEARRAELEIAAFHLGAEKKPNIFKRVFALLFKKS